MIDHTEQKTEVFIVYQKHEEDIASKLKQLFELWGRVSFYCRQGYLEATAVES